MLCPVYVDVVLQTNGFCCMAFTIRFGIVEPSTVTKYVPGSKMGLLANVNVVACAIPVVNDVADKDPEVARGGPDGIAVVPGVPVIAKI